MPCCLTLTTLPASSPPHHITSLSFCSRPHTYSQPSFATWTSTKHPHLLLLPLLLLTVTFSTNLAFSIHHNAPPPARQHSSSTIWRHLTTLHCTITSVPSRTTSPPLLSASAAFIVNLRTQILALWLQPFTVKMPLLLLSATHFTSPPEPQTPAYRSAHLPPMFACPRIRCSLVYLHPVHLFSMS